MVGGGSFCGDFGVFMCHIYWFKYKYIDVTQEQWSSRDQRRNHGHIDNVEDKARIAVYNLMPGKICRVYRPAALNYLSQF